MMLPRRVAVAKIAVAAVVAIAIAAGGVGVYLFTSPQTPSSHTASSVSSSSTSPLGYQDSNGQPVGAWASYLGYVPVGYVVAPHSSNAPSFSCPPQMTSSQCGLFKQSCGNGVCDPNETCSNCPIDCAPTGNLVCDPYTGRPGMPASVCQAIVQNNNAGVFG